MAITYVGYNATAGDWVNLPSYQVGDLFLVLCRSNSASVPVVPSGWRSLGTALNGHGVAAGWRIAQSGDTTSGTWTNANSMFVVVYRGAHPLEPLDYTSTSNVTAGGSGTQFQTTDPAKAYDSSLNVSMAIGGTPTPTVPSGWTSRHAIGAYGVADKTSYAVGTWSWTNAGNLSQLSIALREPSDFPIVADQDTTSGTVTSNSSSWTLTYPTNIAAGDLLLALIATDGAATDTYGGWPAGWTLPTGWDYFSSAANTGHVAAKIAAGSETGTFSVTLSGSEQGAWVIYRIPAGTWFGGTLAESVAWDRIINGGSSLYPDPPSLDPANWAAENTLWFALCPVDTSRHITAYPADTTNTGKLISGGSGGASLGWGRREYNASSWDPGTFTIATSDDWAAATIAVRPGGGAQTQTGSFTASAAIKKTISSSLSASAILRRTQTGSLTGDAFFRKTETGSFTAAATFNKTISGSFSAYAVKRYSTNVPFSAYAVLRFTHGGPTDAPHVFTADSWLRKVVSSSPMASAITKRTQSASFSASAVIRGTATGSFSASALTRRIQTGSATVFATVAKTQTGSFSATATIRKTISSDLIVYAVTKRAQTGSFTAAASLVQTASGSFTAAALFKATGAGSSTANAVLWRAQAGALTANGVNRRTQSASVTASAAIQRTQPSSATADAVIAKTQTGLVSADAWFTAGMVTVPGDFTADSILRKTAAGSFSANATILKTFSTPFSADATVRRTTSTGIALDAVLLRGSAASLTANAIVTRTQSGSATADAVVRQTRTAMATADGVFHRVATASLTTDAIVTRTTAASVTADAQFSHAITGSFSVAAVIKSTTSDSTAASSWLRRVQAASVPADATRLQTIAGAFAADALISSYKTGAVSADAIFNETQADSFSAQALLVITASGSVSADAVVFQSRAGSFSAQAVLALIGSGDFKADAFFAYVGRCVWTTPINFAVISALPTLAFLIPQAVGNMHFEIHIDTVDTFDSPNLRVLKSHVDQDGWEYWDGGAWQPITLDGVANTYAGNEARHTIQVELDGTTWFRRVRAGVV